MPEFTSADIENSRPLDVWRWSDHPDANAFIDKLFPKYFDCFRDRKKAKKYVKVLLLDLYIAFREDPKQSLSLPMTPSAYHKGSRWRSIHINRFIISIVNQAEKCELIDVWRGVEAKKRVTRLRPTKKLTKEFKKGKLQAVTAANSSCRPPIFIKDSDGNRFASYQTNLKPMEKHHVIEMEFQIISYNAQLNNAFIDIPTANSHKIKVNGPNLKDAYVLISDQRKKVWRVFNNSNLDQDGRFYRPWWQQLPKAWREKIFINDKPTVEIDYSGLHINLVYALHGFDLNNHPARIDPYEIEIDIDTAKDIKRKIAKKMMLIAINASNEKQTLQAFRKWVKHEPFNKALPDLKDQTLIPILENLKRKHSAISHTFCAGVGLSLMALDSNILERIITKTINEDIITLTVHDSVIVQRRHYLRVKEIMKETFKEILKDNDIETRPSKQYNKTLGIGAYKPQPIATKTNRYKRKEREWREQQAPLP